MTTDNTTAPDNRKADFLNRIHRTATSRWIRFGLVALIYCLWVVWMKQPWLLIALPLLFDIYITGYIPFTWWKNSKSRAVRIVMSWVDAIVYALILVYFIFAFIGQNYQIPSSSLEGTLLTGDYLFVNKTVYGPRVPMTPVHFPLVHNTMPGFLGGGKSYLESPSAGYRRLAGLRNVESGDIVVFNFPTGDTVLTNSPATLDYYQLSEYVRRHGGEEAVKPYIESLGPKVYYPVDRRENYVKRCVGLPGERIKIVDRTIYIDGRAQAQPQNVQFNYLVAATRPITSAEWHKLGVNLSDVQTLGPSLDDNLTLRANGLTVKDVTSTPHYIVPLTGARAEALRATSGVSSVTFAAPDEDLPLFPFSLSADWDRANYGGRFGLLIPAKGMTIDIDRDAWDTYERCIRVYENNPTAEFRDGKLYIDGEPRDSYTFTMDYYFMMGDNRDKSLDSRYWGFVPEDHIVGTPWRVLISFDRENGGVRWNRILKDANPDK